MTDPQSLFDFIKENIIEMKDIEPDDVDMDSTLDSIELDSLDYVSVQLSIRKKYGVDLDPEVFADGHIVTMRQLVEYIIAEKLLLDDRVAVAQ